MLKEAYIFGKSLVNFFGFKEYFHFEGKYINGEILLKMFMVVL